MLHGIFQGGAATFLLGDDMANWTTRQDLSPELPQVFGNVDYIREEALLRRIDGMLRSSGLETDFIEQAVAAANRAAGREISGAGLDQVVTHASRALRCTLLRTLKGETHRELSKLIAGMPLYQWFCRVSRFPLVRAPSKSTLQRYEQDTPMEWVQRINAGLAQLATGTKARQALRLRQPLDVDSFFMDTTCVELNIHFPTDWVLLRDVVRTSIKAIRLIRRHGLTCRMSAPETFMRAMNRHCIAMSQCRRQADSRRQRKRILRAMKSLVGVVRRHARRYSRALSDRRSETDLTENEAQRIIQRLDKVEANLPGALKQAHERIIGERPVANGEKILSLYEPDVHVVVRGKAGGEVEFGNTLLLCEQRQGLIVTHELFREQAPADVRLTERVAQRLEHLFPAVFHGAVKPALVGDRGFHSRRNARILAVDFFNAVAAKAPAEFQRQCQDRRFVKFQRRRSQTEARVSIVTRCFIGDPLRNKGFLSQQLHVEWAVLAHNFWVLARLPMVKRRRKRAA
jgi:hypothetical protein